MNRPKRIGTAAETAVVRESLAAGVHAQRPALAGSLDVGDVHLDHGVVVVEVKAGQQTLKPTWARIRAWLDEAETEAARVSADALPILVTKRHGSGSAADWFTYWDSRHLARFMGWGNPDEQSVIVSVRYRDFLDLYIHYRQSTSKEER